MDGRKTKKRHNKMVKCALLVVLLIGLMMALSGCSVKAKNEKEIVGDLEVHEAFISDEVQISSCKIIKRQTDVEARSDQVYVTVQTDSQQLTSTLSYVLNYELYNEGWLLESVMRYYDGPWEFSGLQDGQLVEDIKDNDYYFYDWDLEIDTFEVTSEEYNSHVMALYEKHICVDLTAHDTSFIYSASYNVVYDYRDDAWNVQTVNVVNRKYTPTYAPGISATDEVMSLKTGFDRFEYSHTDEYWDDCGETRYYTAAKDYSYGTEFFLVSIPIFFTIDGTEAYWDYREDEITRTLQNVEWDIEGKWSCNYSILEGWTPALHGYAVADLNIYDVMPTDDPTVYKVELFCNAYSTEYSYRCWTKGVEIVELSGNSGSWRINVKRPDDLDSKIVWYDTFFVRDSGIYWWQGQFDTFSDPSVELQKK